MRKKKTSVELSGSSFITCVLTCLFSLFVFLQWRCWTPCQPWPIWAGRPTQVRGWVYMQHSTRKEIILSSCWNWHKSGKIWSQLAGRVFEGPSEDSELAAAAAAALECVLGREHWVLERSLLNRESAGGIYKLFPLRCKLCGTGASIYSGLRFWGMEGEIFLRKRRDVVYLLVLFPSVCVCVWGGVGGGCVTTLSQVEGPGESGVQPPCIRKWQERCERRGRGWERREREREREQERQSAFNKEIRVGSVCHSGAGSCWMALN